MRTHHLAILAVAALAAGACGQSATVEGPGAAKLTLTHPQSVEIERGEMAKADIEIDRNQLTGEVKIRFDQLPAGVEVVDGAQTITGDGETATFTLRASPTADLVKNHVATVTATGPGGVSVTDDLEITVTERDE